MNVIADNMSRAGQILLTEWSLHQDMANHALDTWGHPNMDLFATWYNHRCPTFVLPTLNGRAVDRDPLTIDWEWMFAYAFPTQQILPQVLRKISQMQNCALLLIAPFWPKQS